MGEGNATFKMGLHTHQNSYTGLSAGTDNSTDTVVSVVQTFRCLEMRSRLSTLLIKRGENKCIFEVEYIPVFQRFLLHAISSC